ncbi:hypothetical protein ACE1CD_36730 [Aerosakkonema sp. BLCC-F183]|uniref:hypothetical protein n=1 Tax=Aerosakkonema sp. BLCC-F183 TaxID=3342834 RepID=UPI0035B8910B
MSCICSKIKERQCKLQLFLVRSGYDFEVRNVAKRTEKLRFAGENSEKIARYAHQLRTEIKIKYRVVTPLQQQREISAYTLASYQDELGPSIEYLRNVKNKTWEEIIESASRSNREMNHRLRVDNYWFPAILVVLVVNLYWHIRKSK